MRKNRIRERGQADVEIQVCGFMIEVFAAMGVQCVAKYSRVDTPMVLKSFNDKSLDHDAERSKFSDEINSGVRDWIDDAELMLPESAVLSKSLEYAMAKHFMKWVERAGGSVER